MDSESGVLRLDPTTREWVIFAPGRGKRPKQSSESAPLDEPDLERESCIFCRGGVDMTADILYASPIPTQTTPWERGDPWQVLVIPNKFPALKTDGATVRRPVAPLFLEMDAVGHHEVVIDSPTHDWWPPTMNTNEVAEMLKAYRQRSQELSKDENVQLVLVFKNHGRRAGTSIEHPHSQIIATPVVPAIVRRKFDVALRYYDDTGRCIYCEIVGEEMKQEVRVVEMTDNFVTFVPFAARAPYELWIAPRYHESAFSLIRDEEIGELASVLLSSMRRLQTVLGDFHFNYVINTTPVGDEHKWYYLWHIQIVPRLTTMAGFELGSGMAVNSVLPETAAADLRDADPGTLD